MATQGLALIGTALGGSIGGPGGAAIGAIIGSAIGSHVDKSLGLAPPDTYNYGPRLDETPIQTTAEGAPILRSYGRTKIAGHIIWASRFTEIVTTTETSQGGGGGKGASGPKNKNVEYTYTCSFAIALCEGPIVDTVRFWLDTEVMDLTGVNYRVYKGTETQTADPKIVAVEGADYVPSFKGIAYVVFEDLELTPYGNRIPNITVEVFAYASEDLEEMEYKITALNIIPATGEHAYDPTIVTTIAARLDNGDAANYSGWQTVMEDGVEVIPVDVARIEVKTINANTGLGISDWTRSIDDMETALPNIAKTQLVVSWFGSDLRIGNCKIEPKVEFYGTTTRDPARRWKVSDTERADAARVSLDEEFNPLFGGTPTDQSVYSAIRDLNTRGHSVAFYPFILMDIPAGNTLPNPYSNNAATIGQPVFPWRGRITVSPAAGFTGTVDKTAAVNSQLSAFMGTCIPSNFGVWDGVTIPYFGPNEWTYRRMVLHYAKLCAAAGGVDLFYIGTEMVNMLSMRSNTSTYPAVTAMQTLAAEVSSILGSGCKVTYAADWSEWNGHSPGDGTNDFHFHLDPLWADPNIDVVAIDNYMPLSDWRHTPGHLDGVTYESIYNRDYLASNVEGGEYYDWYYADIAARNDQTRLPIVDSAYGDHWVFRRKDIKNWWLNQHRNRPAGVKGATLPTGFELLNGTMTINSVVEESGFNRINMTLAYNNTSGSSTVAVAFRTTSATSPAATAGQTWISSITGKIISATHTTSLFIDERNASFVTVANSSIALSTTEQTFTLSRLFTNATTTKASIRINRAVAAGENYSATLEIKIPVLRQSGDVNQLDPVFTGVVSGVVNASTNITAWVPQSKPIIFSELGCPAIDKGSNQPNVFVDPKSSESVAPYYSLGTRDDAIQRRFIETHFNYWADVANNPVSTVYTDKMIDTTSMYLWTWDSRPYPYFPSLRNVWKDAYNWELGHWLSGRAGALELSVLVNRIMSTSGVAYDTSKLVGTVFGYSIDGVMSIADALQPLMNAYFFDMYESRNTIVFRHRGTKPDWSITAADCVRSTSAGDFYERVRIEDTELPQLIRLSFIDVSTSLQIGTAVAQKLVGNSKAVFEINIPVVMQHSAAENIVNTILHEMHLQREHLQLTLAPRFFAVEPTDIIDVTLDEISGTYRVDEVSRENGISLALTRTSESVYVNTAITASLVPLITNATPIALFAALLDLPLLSDDTATTSAPWIAAYSTPWAPANFLYSPEDTNYNYDTTIIRRADIGNVVFNVSSGPEHQWDVGNTIRIVMAKEALQLLSTTEENVMNGSNLGAIKCLNGEWEIFSWVTATLVGNGIWDLTKLLRGRFGTEKAMQSGIAAGAEFVVVSSLTRSNMPNSLRTLALNWKFGPSSRDISDDTYNTVIAVIDGIGLRPLSVVNIKATKSLTTEAIVFSFLRRCRLPGLGDDWDTPLAEDIEKYEIDVRNVSDTTVLRTITTLTQSAEYTVAQQITDFGGSISTVIVEIFQISTSYGRGEGRKVTLNSFAQVP